MTVRQIVAEYWKHAKQYYRKNGKVTGQIHGIRVSLRYLKDMYGRTPAAESRPDGTQGHTHKNDC